MVDTTGHATVSILLFFLVMISHLAPPPTHTLNTPFAVHDCKCDGNLIHRVLVTISNLVDFRYNGRNFECATLHCVSEYQQI